MAFFRVPKDNLVKFLNEEHPEIDGSQKKPDLLKDIIKEEIDYAEYVQWYKRQESQKKEIPDNQKVELKDTEDYVMPDKVLVRMTAKFTTFSTGGFKFTQKHPFAVMSSEDAQQLIDKYEFFTYATKDNVEEYYGDKA